MSAHGLTLLAVYVVVLLALAVPLARHIELIARGQGAWLRVARPVEAALFRVAGVDPTREMGWVRYAMAILAINGLGLIACYALQRLQAVLPLNPQAFPAISPDSAFNTAISFVTNTNWQAYSGESAMGNLVQMLALAVQNFLSAATGIAVLFALVRGFARHESATVGNAWVDLTRITLHVLLPLSVLMALVLASQGVIQNFSAYRDVQTLEVTQYDNPRLDAAGQAVKDAAGNALTDRASLATQTLPMGPVASQEAIKMLGTNGGGFFNANSANPFENPTPLSNFVQMLAIFLIPAALCLVFGRLVGDTRQGWVVLVAMMVVFLGMALLALHAEAQANPAFAGLGVDASAGNLEGKETRFGIDDSALFATLTTLASCGAVNAMHDSLMPMGGLVTLVNMMLGEVIFGGVGTGLYSMMIFAVLAVFIAGLMIGRTPEYLGKKIDAFDMKMVSIAILVTPILVLTGAAVAVRVPEAIAGVANPGAHGFSEILYAFTSAANNNGSAFAGLSANTLFYNVALALAMWFGRFGMIIPVLALAGALAAKKRIAVHAGTMPTHGPLFVVLLVGTVLLVGALNYVPALALGPVVEHIDLFARKPAMPSPTQKASP